MEFGFKLTTEAFGPKEIIEQAVRAEQLGFDFVEASDHFHPWLDNQGHSANTWLLFANIAARTERIGIVTGVTCPSFRYHPALVAQQAATLQIISDGRFTLGVGSGERLNEHVIGRDWPSVRVRHEYFREALEIIRLLWQGGYRHYEGKHLQLDDARIFDLPDRLPEICVAVSGPKSIQIAVELGDGLFATEPRSELVSGYTDGGGTGPKYVEVQLAWAPDVEAAAQAVVDKGRFALTGWKVLSELPNPVNFEAATSTVTTDDVKQVFACGPDVDVHVAQIQKFMDAGFDHLVLQNGGPDPDGFWRFWTDELQPRVHGLTPSPS
ncbi:TIGR03557 family F420-dependent LLM class oxidoreductase [Modestobacter sp. SSW1-42]|uniref:TIGR03557 family F420-dependent LLM class oxidoreductase n=1 Tax=Modestobacter sp. SSW1-42 TaxID=596372 RepID=UPI003987B2E5